MDISLEDMVGQVVSGTLQDHDIRVFTPSGNVLLAIMHHGGKDHFLMMRHLLDIGLLLGKHNNIDWTWIMSMARKFNIEKLVYVAVKLASDLTGVEIPNRIEVKTKVESAKIRKLAEDRLRQMSLSPDQWNKIQFEYNNLIFQLRSRPDIKVRARLIELSCMRLIIRHMVPEKLHLLYRKIKLWRYET